MAVSRLWRRGKLPHPRGRAQVNTCKPPRRPDHLSSLRRLHLSLQSSLLKSQLRLEKITQTQFPPIDGQLSIQHWTASLLGLQS